MENNSGAISKRELQKEIRRNEIIEAGIRIFTTHGFTATRLDDVAELAGVGKGTIYLYFDSKESLFEAVVYHSLVPDISKQDRNLLLEGTAEDNLVEIIRGMYQQLSNAYVPQIMALVVGEAGRFPRLSEFIYKELIQQHHELIKKVILKGMAEGEFRDIGYENFPQIIISPILSAATWKLQFDSYSPLDLERFEHIHIETILSALKK